MDFEIVSEVLMLEEENSVTEIAGIDVRFQSDFTNLGFAVINRVIGSKDFEESGILRN